MSSDEEDRGSKRHKLDDEYVATDGAEGTPTWPSPSHAPRAPAPRQGPSTSLLPIHTAVASTRLYLCPPWHDTECSTVAYPPMSDGSPMSGPTRVPVWWQSVPLRESRRAAMESMVAMGAPRRP